MCVLLFVSFVGRMCLKEPVTVLENGMVCCGKIQRRCIWLLRPRYIRMYEIIYAVKSNSKGNTISSILVLPTCKWKTGGKMHFELLLEFFLKKNVFAFKVISFDFLFFFGVGRGSFYYLNAVKPFIYI